MVDCYYSHFPSPSQHVTVPVRRRQDVHVRVGRPQQEAVIDAAEIDPTPVRVVVLVVVGMMVMVVQTVGRAQQWIPVQSRNITN